MTALTENNPHAPSRLESRESALAAWAAMAAMQQSVNAGSIDPALRELIALRASQINGCAFCIDLHVRRSQERGERADRLYLLDAWRDAGVYSKRERAALLWTEALTRLSDGRGVSDAVFAEARAEFSETELVELTLAIVTINGWNRLNVAFRVPPGTD